MFEKYGYKKEDILKWVEEIKPEIKHLHVHEAQAGEDTHLSLGMGWDDIVASELEKLRDILENKKVQLYMNLVDIMLINSIQSMEVNILI